MSSTGICMRALKPDGGAHMTCASLGSDLDSSPACICLHLFVLYLCNIKEESFNFETKVEIGVAKQS